MPEGLLEAVVKAGPEVEEIGTTIGKLYTDHGLPIDMALSRLNHSKEAKIAILHHALHWLVEHKRNSGATQKAIDRQRKLNRGYIEKFISSGEAGIY